MDLSSIYIYLEVAPPVSLGVPLVVKGMSMILLMIKESQISKTYNFILCRTRFMNDFALFGKICHQMSFCKKMNCILAI